MKASLEEKTNSLLDLACLGSEHDRPGRLALAKQLLLETPELETQNVFTLALCGAHQALAALLKESPHNATARGGPRDWSPLRYLCYGRVPAGPGRDWVKAARLLLDAGADPNDTVVLYEKCHYTLLTGAVGEGEGGIENQPPHSHAYALVNILLDAGASPNDGQALYNTHFTPDDGLLRLLLSRGLKQGDLANFGDDGTTTLDYLLCAAVDAGLVERVRLLLEHQANANAKSIYNSRSAYALAMRSGREQIAQMLLAAGAEAALDSEDQFLVLIQQCNREGARKWLSEHPELAKSSDIFVQFAERGELIGVDLMLDAGTDVHTENRNKRTALHVAAMNDRREVARLLVSRGASVEKRDASYGGTPPSWAHVHGKFELRDELLNHSTDFFDLVRFGCLERVQARLQECPELVQSMTPMGNTVFHLISGDTAHPEQMIELLLRAGANINATNASGKSPLDVQEPPEDAITMELLRARGALPAN